MISCRKVDPCIFDITEVNEGKCCTTYVSTNLRGCPEKQVADSFFIPFHREIQLPVHARCIQSNICNSIFFPGNVCITKLTYKDTLDGTYTITSDWVMGIT